MNHPTDTAIDDGDHRGFEVRRHNPDQPSLFPTEDLIIPETITSIRKAVSAIHASPVRAEHSQSLNSRRLFDACILIAQIDFRKRDKLLLERIKNDRVSPMFETRISDLVRLAGIPGKNFERVYEELDALFEMSLRWNIVGEDQDVQWEMKSHFLSMLGYGRGHKRGLIRFSIDPSILEIVLEPSNWATLSLQAMEGLGTASSYALYQNCWRYINTQAKVTAILPAATWIELLMGQSRYVVDDPEMGKRVVNYGDFKRRVLLDAIRRVNEIQALGYTLELKEYYSGKRVSKLQFKFVSKKQASLGLPLMWPEDILRVLASVGLGKDDIEDLSQAHSYEEIADSIVRLKAAEVRLRAAGRPMSSRKAYFYGILSNIASGEAVNDTDHAKLEAQVNAQAEQQAAAARHERRREEFSRHQAEIFAQKLFDMPENERELLCRQFEETPSGAKARPLLERGWSRKNVGALSLLRAWVVADRSDVAERIFVNPQDRDFDAWMAWRLDSIPPV